MIVVAPFSVVATDTVNVSVVVPPVTTKPLLIVAQPDNVVAPETLKPPAIPRELPDTLIPLERDKVPSALAVNIAEPLPARLATVTSVVFEPKTY